MTTQPRPLMQSWIPFKYSPVKEEMNDVTSREFTREEYREIMYRKNKDFLEKYFKPSMDVIFSRLREDAEKRLPCNAPFVLPIPDHFDRSTVERSLTAYFVHLGYIVTIEAEKDKTSKDIRMTLT
jgi:hypothetical protein